MTSSQLLRVHIDRGHQRHGYPWVPTDQGLSRPRQVGPTYRTTRRPDMWAQGRKDTWRTRKDISVRISFPYCNQLG
jgi:hypothetical protein